MDDAASASKKDKVLPGSRCNPQFGMSLENWAY